MNKEECRRTESLEVLFCFVIGNCCNVVVVRQEFRKKFLPKCVRWHALFLKKLYNDKAGKNDYNLIEY